MSSTKIGKNLYPDLTEEIVNNVKEFEKRYKLKLDFLFDDGIKISYSKSEYEPNTDFGSFRLLDPTTKEAIIKVIINFDFVEFFDCYNKKILTIPILEDYDI